MPKAYLTRVERFSSAHRLHSPQLTQEENQQLYGKCNHPNFHGHNYKLSVTLFGEVNEMTGMVMNISDLKQIIQETVLEHLDHKNVDLDVPYFFEGKRASTAENISIYIWNQLLTKIPKELLYEVRLFETEKNIVSYKGE